MILLFRQACVFPGKEPVAAAVAKITGKEMGVIEGSVAVIGCARCLRSHYEKYEYVGYGNCSAADMSFPVPRIACTGASGSASAPPSLS